MDDSEVTLAVCSILAKLPGWNGPDRATHSGGTDVALFYGAIDSMPDVAVGVRVYGDGGSTSDNREIRLVQLRFRGARNQPNSADRLAGLAHSVLTSVSRQAGINGITRISLAPSGADSNGREGRTDNYRIILDNLEASNEY